MSPERKRILFLTNRLPFPPDKGDKIRTFHQLDHLALRHRVWCACFTDNPEDAERAGALQRWCEEVIVLPWNRRRAAVRAAAGWLGGWPLTVGAYRDRAMRRRLGGWIAETRFDAAVAFSTSVATYAMQAPARRRVLDLCDVDSQKWFDYAAEARFPMSAVFRAEGARLREFEHACLHRFDDVVLITPRERDILDPQRRCRHLHVVPNGVTLHEADTEPASRRGMTVGFVGAMDYRPNVEGVCWFVEEIWPRVLTHAPYARLLVVGRNPVRRIQNLARHAGVEITGAVRDVRTSLLRCRVSVAPLRVARGLQNKVLEAMALRRPVVATSAVAGGMQVEAGRQMLVADKPADFAEQVLRLLTDDRLCDAVAEAGRRCAETHYRWPDALDRYERIVLGCAEAEPAAGDVTVVEKSAARTGVLRSSGTPAKSATLRARPGA